MKLLQYRRVSHKNRSLQKRKYGDEEGKYKNEKLGTIVNIWDCVID